MIPDSQRLQKTIRLKGEHHGNKKSKLGSYETLGVDGQS